MRKAGDRLRMSAQLIDAAGGFHVWCEQYDRTLEDIFALQDDFAGSCRGAEGGTARAECPPVITPSTASMDAYVLYLRGRAFWHQRFAGHLEKAMECFGQAIQKDPGFALAVPGLADSFTTLGVWGFVPPDRAFRRRDGAGPPGDRARSPAGGPVRVQGADPHVLGLGVGRGRAGVGGALALNPGCALVQVWYGHYLTIVGRFDEAVAEVVHAQSLDPLFVGRTRTSAGRSIWPAGTGRAIDELQQVLARFPGNPMALLDPGLRDGRSRTARRGRVLLRSVRRNARRHAVGRGVGWMGRRSIR